MAAHFQVLAIGAPCLASPPLYHPWPVFTSIRALASSWPVLSSISTLAPESLFPQFLTCTFATGHQTQLVNLLAANIESAQAKEHFIVFLLVQTLHSSLLLLLWPQDRKQRGMAFETLGARKTTLVFSPCTSTSTYIGLVHCQLFASTLLQARIGDEMMKCLTVRILGATGTILKTDPEIQMFIQILQIGIQIQQQQRRVSVFSGARGRGAGKGGLAVKIASGP